MTTRVRRPGEWDNRPLSGKRGEPVPRFTFALTEYVHDALVEMAYRDEMTMSEWIREVIVREATKRGLFQQPPEG